MNGDVERGQTKVSKFLDNLQIMIFSVIFPYAFC